MDKMSLVDAARTRAMQCFANQFLFEKRAQRYSAIIGAITKLGILIPCLIGLTALGYTLENPSLKAVFPLAATLSFIQGILSTIATLNGWDSKVSYAHEAMQSYNLMFSQFTELADFPPDDLAEFKRRFDLIRVVENQRSMQDGKQGIAEWEYRMGVHASLRLHQKPCVKCKVTPENLRSTDCGICGNYSFTFKYLPWK